ncbi:MAG: SNF2-related protein, partial [Chloroflexota bacterium]
DKPQQRLLTGLGYAARFFKPIQRSLQQRSPAGMSLTGDEAYAFLRQCAPQLQRAGFGLLVPPWWNKPGTRLGIRLKLGSTAKLTGQTAVSTGRLSLDDLVRYQWQLSLGNTELTREEFDALVTLKSPLVQIRGQWVQLDPEQIEAAIRFWQQQGMEGTLSLPEAMKLGLSAEEQQRNGLPVDGVELDDWLQSWLNRLQGEEKLAMLPTPEGLRATLRPYQQYGYSWLHFARRWGLGVILADDMGLGKCVAPDTQILINGTLLTAETVWQTFTTEIIFDGEGYWAEPDQSLIVNSMDNDTGKIVSSPITKLYRQAIREPMQRIVLEDGSTITITRRHQLWTPSGWTNHFQLGDYVSVPAKLPWDGRPVSPSLVQFLAWQIAEGYELKERATVHITQKEISRLNELKVCLQQIAQQFDLEINQPKIHEPSAKSPYLTLNSRAYQSFLEANGYEWGHKSAGKKIPPFVMQADSTAVALFLKHFFEAEGSVSLKMRTVEISSASQELLMQLAVLLRRFGVWLRINARQKRATNGSGIYQTYYVGTFGGHSARLFQQSIGFLSEKKQKKLDQICQGTSNTNVEGVPASQLIARLVQETKLPLRHLGMYNTVYVNGTQEFSRESLNRVATSLNRVLTGESLAAYQQKPRSKWTEQTLAAYKELDYEVLSEYSARLQRFLNEEVFYCRVKRVEQIDYEGWVYDFEVAHHHNFVANNMICHNTVQTLSLIQQLKEETESLPAPILLICPTSVVTNWELERQKFTPGLRAMLHQGADRLRDDAFLEAAQASDMVLTSYALARRDAEAMKQINWFGVVLDEAQNIKNANTKQAQIIRKLPADFRLALTGTPVENRLSELWSIMQFLNPGFLGGQKQFHQEFTLPIEKYGDEDAAQKLRKMTRPFLLRRVKTDPTVIQDLPDKQEMKVYCHLSEEQATLYEAVVQDALAAIEEQEEGGMARKGQVLSMLMQLKQVCNHPAQYLHQTETYKVGEDNGRSGKLDRLTDLLEEILAEGDRLLIFSQFTEMAGLLKGYIQETFGVPTLYLHGGVPPKKRAVMVEQFQREDGPPVFLLSLKAGGTGLNLTRANHVFHFDRWWNPAVEDQATDRAFRIGQTKNVLVHKFVCLGTLEERIDAMISDKKALAESIIGGGENWLTEMSTADLRSLVQLRRE